MWYDIVIELKKCQLEDTDDLYRLLDSASKILRNLANKKELNTTTTNENV